MRLRASFISNRIISLPLALSLRSALGSVDASTRFSFYLKCCVEQAH